jgi:C1A family cysteine protease
MNYSKLAFCATAIGILSGIAVAESENSAIDIDALETQGKLEGWTFDVSDNPATEYNLADLTGVVEPRNWRENSRFDEGNLDQRLVLPTTYDWRNSDGENFCTPIRDQGSCGSCWAFAVMGSMESNIRIHDGLSTDLSEQWLVSCCGLGGCSGEWPGNAANYLLESGAYTDVCGEYGSALESDFPYEATDAPCVCTTDHPYTINDWAFIGPQWGTPTTDQLKEAIMEHGPIIVCVTVNNAFQAYDGGVFNSSDTSPINHAVVLVGWDDSQGENGVWFMRNSWNTWWGEAGYMRIEYGCSNIGYGALYLDYPSSNGSCCIGDYCVYGPATACDSAGGVFNGFGSRCEDVICTQPCEGDITADGWVDVVDLLEVIAQWGTSDSTADLNSDGIVDVTDLLEVVEHWGSCD